MEQVGPYRKGEKLGEGAMSEVHRAIHRQLGHEVAIKALRPADRTNAEMRARLKREGEVLSRLQHPNIVAIEDVIEVDGEPFIVMELVNGQTLDQLLKSEQESRLSCETALHLFLQVLAALDHAHQRKIVHRDLKPNNVMVANGHVKVTDFGIALVGDVPRFTAPRMKIGTWKYMSPEQLRGDDLDGRSDIYSAGVLVYRMIAGREPFDVETDLALAHAQTSAPPPLTELVPDTPPAVSAAVAIALDYEPNGRFKTAGEFARVLKEAKDGLFPEQPQITVVSKPVDATQSDVPSTAAAAPPARANNSHKWLPPVSFMFIVTASIGGYWLSRHTPEVIEIMRHLTPPAVRTGHLDLPWLDPTVVLTTPSPDGVRTTVAAPPKTPRIVEPPVVRQTADPRRDNNALRAEINAGLQNVLPLINSEQFDEAKRVIAELRGLANRSTELTQERDAIDASADDLAGAIAKFQEWQRSVDEVERDVGLERFAEVRNRATQLLHRTDLPRSLAPRLQDALDVANKRIFESHSVTAGPTTNTIVVPKH